MNFFIALILLAFLFLLSTIVPMPHDFSQEQINKWKNAPFDGIEFLPNLKNDIPLCQWLGWNMSRGALPTLIMVFLFSTLAPFFLIIVICAQIYIPRYQPNSILKPRFEIPGFLGCIMILNPLCLLVAIFSAVSVYFLIGDHLNKEKRIHSTIFSGFLFVLVFSGIRGGVNFLPILLGIGILCYRNFCYLKGVLDLIPEVFQFWIHDEINNKHCSEYNFYEEQKASVVDSSDSSVQNKEKIIPEVIIDSQGNGKEDL